MATSAAKAVWGGDGEDRKEPVSGVAGDTSKGEPYDAGNLDTSDQNKLEKKMSGDASAPARHNPGTIVDNKHDTTSSATTSANTTSANTTSANTTSANTTSANTTSANTTSSNTIAADTAAADTIPGDKTAANTTPGDKTAANTTSADKTTAGSGPGPASDPASEDKPSTGDDGADPSTKIMGDGPKDLAAVAREHGGDAGNNTEKYKGESDKSAAGADGPGDSKDASDNNESEGTGDQYVKTTGLAADGGDFDATKPGAGREADRLLEQKGIHHEGGPAKDAHKDSHKGSHKDSHKDAASPSSGGKDKPSLGERIKNKLHRH